MASKFDGDVRPLSNDRRYMGLVFTSHQTGTIEEAIEQARTAWDYGLSEQRVPAGMSRDRAVLLQHLNLLPTEAQIQARVDEQVNGLFADYADIQNLNHHLASSGFADQAFIDHLNNDPRN